MPNFPYTIYIPHIPTQLEALSSGFRLVDQAVKIAADQVVEAGAAVTADDLDRSAQWMNRFVDAEIAAHADILALLVHCSFHPAERGPSIGRKRRARRARGRANG